MPRPWPPPPPGNIRLSRRVRVRNAQACRAKDSDREARAREAECLALAVEWTRAALNGLTEPLSEAAAQLLLQQLAKDVYEATAPTEGRESP